ARSPAPSFATPRSAELLITRVHTSDGLVGETYNGDEIHTQVEIGRIITDELAPLLVGADPTMVEKCWETMVPVTFDILRDRRLRSEEHTSELQSREKLV